MQNALVNHEYEVWLGCTLLGALAMAVAVWVGVNGSMFFMIFAIISIFLLGFRDIVSGKAQKKQVSSKLFQVATNMGFEFEDRGPCNVLGWPNEFQLTRKAVEMEQAIYENCSPDSMLGKIAAGAIPKAANIMRRADRDFSIVLFDYEYTDNEVEFAHAVAAISSDLLNRPYFALFPVSHWNRFTDLLGFESKRIRQHCLQGSDKDPAHFDSIAQLLDDESSLEAGQGFMLLYTDDRRGLKHIDVEELHNKAIEIFDNLVEGGC